MKTQKSIFDFLNDITYHKVKWEDHTESDQKRFQPYMLSRWLSMHPDYLEIVAEVQPITSRMDSREFYTFFSDLLPRRKFFAKYVKSTMKPANLEELIAFISSKMMIGKKEAIDIINISSTDVLIQFIQQYGYSEKDIKKQFGL